MDIELELIEEDPWLYQATLLAEDTVVGEYTVTMSSDEYRDFGGSEEPDEVVRAVLRFLLDRESPEMILDRFTLTETSEHFPEFTEQIKNYF